MKTQYGTQTRKRFIRYTVLETLVRPASLMPPTRSNWAFIDSVTSWPWQTRLSDPLLSSRIVSRSTHSTAEIVDASHDWISRHNFPARPNEIYPQFIRFGSGWWLDCEVADDSAVSENTLWQSVITSCRKNVPTLILIHVLLDLSFRLHQSRSRSVHTSRDHSFVIAKFSSLFLSLSHIGSNYKLIEQV